MERTALGVRRERGDGRDGRAGRPPRPLGPQGRNRPLPPVTRCPAGNVAGTRPGLVARATLGSARVPAWVKGAAAGDSGRGLALTHWAVAIVPQEARAQGPRITESGPFLVTSVATQFVF